MHTDEPTRENLRLGFGHAWSCGWCDEWVSGWTRLTTHVKLLWHQVWNHRERISEEYE